MGLITAEIDLNNPTRADGQSLKVKCLVDTGALHLCIPEHIAHQLGYDLSSSKQTREVTTADGRKHLRPYVGPIRVSFKNRVGFVGAVVMGDEILLGAVPMEDMDLVVIPSRLTVDVNPDYPNIAFSRS